MDIEPALKLIERLIETPSVTGNEAAATSLVSELLRERGFEVALYPVRDGRQNIFVAVGSPKIVFSTHLDVVPAPEQMFRARWEGDRLFGRGSCDAKGIAACMIEACTALRDRGMNDFGMLFVVGEELEGDGAKQAERDLVGMGIRCIVNGEPTECKSAIAHKGLLHMRLLARGRACHSGYPELGVDANAKLVKTLSRLMERDYGDDPVLGKTTLTVGMLGGGSAVNIVSDRAWAACSFRTVVDPQLILEQVKPLIGPECEIESARSAPLCRMVSIPGVDSTVVSYSTDIPHLAKLGTEFALYGPGSIFRAHTDEEFIARSEVAEAIEGYQTIFTALRGRYADA